MYSAQNNVPYRSSLRYNTMVHDVMSWLQIEAFIYSRLKGREICQRALLAPPVIIQWQPITHTSSTEAFALIEFHTPAGGEHINRATFVIGGKDRDPAPVGNHPGVFHVRQTCRHR